MLQLRPKHYNNFRQSCAFFPTAVKQNLIYTKISILIQQVVEKHQYLQCYDIRRV